MKRALIRAVQRHQVSIAAPNSLCVGRMTEQSVNSLSSTRSIVSTSVRQTVCAPLTQSTHHTTIRSLSSQPSLESRRQQDIALADAGGSDRRPFVSAKWLKQKLDSPQGANIRVLDCSWRMRDPIPGQTTLV